MKLSQNDIKKIKSLSSKKYRDKYNLFTVEGEKMTNEVLNTSHIVLDRQDELRSLRCKGARGRFIVENVYHIDEIGEKAMSRITSFSSPSPVLAVVRKPKDLNLDDVSEIKDVISKPGLYLALDSVRDPGNMGTILRLADWFGIDAIFASKDSVDIFNPKTVQATMGAIFRVKFHYVDIPTLCSCCRENSGKVYGTFLDGENLYEKKLDTGKDCPVVIITGNEAHGISKAVENTVSDKLYIPSYPDDSSGSESLNAAIATAVTVAEFRRRIL